MKKTWWLGLTVFIIAAGIISAASIGYAKSYGYSAGSVKWVFGGGKAQLRNTQEFAAEGIKHIEIAYSSQNVVFYPAEDDEIIIKEYYWESRKEVDSLIEKDGDTLRAKGTEQLVVFMFSFGGEERIEVYLPKSYQGSVDVLTRSGNIKSDTKLELSSLKAEASSGNISFNEVYADEIAAQANSGNIGFHCAAGAVREFSTSSGNIRVDSGAGDTKASANSGNIDIEEIDGGFFGSASSGNIKAGFVRTGGDIAVSAASGNIRLEIPKDSSFSYKGSASSGTIHTDFDNVLTFNKARNKASGEYGQNTEKVIATKTSSGNTSIIFD